MKKIISLLLILTLSFSFAACSGGSKIDSAIAEADKLIESGDYAGALEALQAADEYAKLTAKISATRLAQLQAEKGNIIGSWMSLDGTTKLIFNEDFTGKLISLGSDLDKPMDYEITADGLIYITYPSLIKLSVVQEDGITKLVNMTGNTTYVSEANYQLFAPEVVELTMDNWQEYFELRQAIDFRTNKFGDFTVYIIGYGLFLKDAYMDRLEDLYDVSFRLEADQVFRVVTLDEATGDYTMGEYLTAYGYDDPHGVFTSNVSDHRNFTGEDPRTSSYQQVCGIVTSGQRTEYNGIRYETVLENPVLTGIQGTIELRK